MRKEIRELLDSEKPCFKKPVSAILEVISAPQNLFNNNYTRRKAADKFLKELRVIKSLPGRRAAIERHNKLVSDIMHLIGDMQDRTFTPEATIDNKKIAELIKNVELLDKCLLIDPFNKGMKLKPRMKLLEVKISPTLDKIIKTFPEDKTEAWYIFHNLTSQIYYWRTKAEKARNKELSRIEADLASYKNAVRRLNNKKKTKKIAA
jgi:hypothetical protein